MSSGDGEGGSRSKQSEPERKKKRKKRRSAGESAGLRTSKAQAGGDGRPAFARSFPRDPELDRLVAVFEAGDYARVRTETPKLIRATDDDDVRRAARELMRRLEPDPLAVYMLVAAALLLGFLSYWYWTHKHVAP